MAKDYWVQFGSGDPRVTTGLSPTFIIFQNTGGSAITAPSVTEPGTGTGLYKFTYGPTVSIVFTLDGGSGLSDTNRYVAGVLDPIQAVDEKVGTVNDSFGSTLTDPSTVLGYLKRGQEFNEGNAVFTKATGIWDVYSRGSSTLLREKTLTDTTTSATKS